MVQFARKSKRAVAFVFEDTRCITRLWDLLTYLLTQTYLRQVINARISKRETSTRAAMKRGFIDKNDQKPVPIKVKYSKNSTFPAICNATLFYSILRCSG